MEVRLSKIVNQEMIKAVSIEQKSMGFPYRLLFFVRVASYRYLRYQNIIYASNSRQK